MVEFTHDQAFEMLDKSKTNAIQRLKECEVCVVHPSNACGTARQIDTDCNFILYQVDLELLRNNATTVEVGHFNLPSAGFP
jgi:hypothetical protein